MHSQRRPRFSLDLLRAFESAARHLSFTRAAQELFLTQSAISQAIRTIESQLGQPLFRRVHRGLELTRAGQDLCRVTREALGGLDEAIERIAGARCSLNVVTTPALASLWLAPRLPRFQGVQPTIDVRVIASNDRPDLERDQFDMALRFVAAGAEQPRAEQLFECHSFPVCSPQLAAGAPHPLREPADLAFHVRLDYESLRDGKPWSEWDFWFDAMKVPRRSPSGTLWFPQYDQLVAAAAEGSGVAIGVLPHVAALLRTGRLCAPFGAGRIARRGVFFVVRRPDSPDQEAIDAFVSWLREESAGEATAPPQSLADGSWPGPAGVDPGAPPPRDGGQDR